ncbi:MAG: hypothetical protein IT433_10040 [Phycisphaerales bacterium]|nr:hypothetical protein [Phycisphaerales bacterium]
MAAQIVTAAKIHEYDCERLPRLAALWATGMVDPTIAVEFAPAKPSVGSAGLAAGTVSAPMVQVQPCRAVKKGEAWGGPGEVTDVVRPACRYELMSDGTVVEMEEAEYQRGWAGRVTLGPWK